MSWQLTPKFSQTARSSGGIAIETVYFVLQEMNHDTKYRMMENLFLHLRKCHFFHHLFTSSYTSISVG